MNYIDTKYINLISVRLEKFSRKKDGIYNFRCPYCGDSYKNKSKARGYLFDNKNVTVYKCHNCGVTTNFSSFLKQYASDLYDEYLLENYKQGFSTNKLFEKLDKEFNFEAPKFTANIEGLIRVRDLNKTHQARKYVDNRKIPEDKLKEIYYVPQYKKWVNKQKPTFKDTYPDHSRLIIPLISDNKWFGFQARSLNPKNSLRYLTTILDESKPKVYNLDGVDYQKPVYITEGAFDSMFVSNSIAMVGADIDWLFLKSHIDTEFVFVYDNEPRNAQIVARMEKAIDRKHSIVIWPKSLDKKDINDMIIAELNPQKIIKDNTYTGLEAKIKFIEWKKV
jgi:hypothetical protein